MDSVVKGKQCQFDNAYAWITSVTQSTNNLQSTCTITRSTTESDTKTQKTFTKQHKDKAQQLLYVTEDVEHITRKGVTHYTSMPNCYALCNVDATNLMMQLLLDGWMAVLFEGQ